MPLSLLIVGLIISGVILLLLLAGSLWLARQALYPRKFTYEKSFDLEVEHGRLNETEFQSWNKQEIAIRSPFGYTLSGTYFPLSGSQKTIIMLHGFTYTRLGMVKYVPLFRRRGWNILIYDQRFFGRSGGLNTTFGFYEKHDLQAVFDWALKQIGPQGVIGTLGESLGAATCLQHAAIDPRAAFVIADSSFTTLHEELAFRLKTDYNLPPIPLLTIGEGLIRLLAGFSFSQVVPEKDVAYLEMPVLFVHGLNDREVPPVHSRRLFAAKQRGMRRLFMMPGAGHVESVWTDRAAYDREVGIFLTEAGI